MPTVLRWKGYRFFWYQSDGAEPRTSHIFMDAKECKVWLNDLSVAVGTPRALVGVTAAERDKLLETLREHFR